MESSTDAPIDGVIKDTYESINGIAGNVVFKLGNDLSYFLHVICFPISFKNFSTSFVTLFYLDSVNSNFCSEPTILIILLINEVCKITGVNENT